MIGHSSEMFYENFATKIVDVAMKFTVSASCESKIMQKSDRKLPKIG